jgi:hypothetical protein
MTMTLDDFTNTATSVMSAEDVTGSQIILSRGVLSVMTICFLRVGL